MRWLKISSTQIFFILILLLAIFFRFYNLNSIPPSPSLDEVSIGYNAYSILHTGRDEYGNFMPVLLRAYDDWRPALYVYLVVPFIKFLGLSVLSVRLPSAILSLITVIATFFLTEEICSKQNFRIPVALFAMSVITISPWHLYISRLGHEVNAGSAFGVLGVLFFLKSLRDHYKWLIVPSIVFFSLAIHTYQSEKIFIPLMVILLFLLFSNKLLKMKKELIVAIVCGIIISLPIFLATFTQQGITRLNATSAFANINLVYEQNARDFLKDKHSGNKIGEVLDNRRFVPVRIFLTNYFLHFSLPWLIENQGNEQFKIPGVGIFFPWEIFLIIIGVIFLALVNFDIRIKILFYSWSIIALIAPALTTQAPHAMRAYTALPAPQILSSLGFAGLIIISRKYLRTEFILVIYFISAFIVLMSGLYLYRQYFVIFPVKQSEPYQYALSRAIVYMLPLKDNYKNIVISNQNDLLQSYMYYLFYSKYDPVKYLRNGGTPSGGFAIFHKIDSISFRPINWIKDKEVKNSLIVGDPSDFPDNNDLIYKSPYLDGKEGIWIRRI